MLLFDVEITSQSQGVIAYSVRADYMEQCVATKRKELVGMYATTWTSTSTFGFANSDKAGALIHTAIDAEVAAFVSDYKRTVTKR